MRQRFAVKVIINTAGITPDELLYNFSIVLQYSVVISMIKLAMRNESNGVVVFIRNI